MNIDEQKKEALLKLREIEQKKITLTRDVFFVPGWSSENCAAWLVPYSPENISMKQWVERTIVNWPEKTHFITFTDQESKKCRGFVDFGKILKEKIDSILAGKESEFDLIGHSMGGLDISAAIIYQGLPFEKLGNVITLGSPFHGAEWGQMVKDFSKFSWFCLGGWAIIRIALIAKGFSYYHILQLENMNPKGKAIKNFNTRDNRIKLLDSVQKLYTFFGTDDDAVKESALFNGFEIDKDLLKRKLRAVCIEGAQHSGALGLTQDPRVVLKIILALSGTETV